MCFLLNMNGLPCPPGLHPQDILIDGILFQGAVKVMAKDLIRTRHQIEKFYKLKSQLQGVSLRIQVCIFIYPFYLYVNDLKCAIFFIEVFYMENYGLLSCLVSRWKSAAITI